MEGRRRPWWRDKEDTGVSACIQQAVLNLRSYFSNSLKLCASWARSDNWICWNCWWCTCGLSSLLQRFTVGSWRLFVKKRNFVKEKAIFYKRNRPKVTKKIRNHTFYYQKRNIQTSETDYTRISGEHVMPRKYQYNLLETAQYCTRAEQRRLGCATLPSLQPV
jgi:hypothetical protein